MVTDQQVRRLFMFKGKGLTIPFISKEDLIKKELSC
jgi:hypothetical protein